MHPQYTPSSPAAAFRSRLTSTRKPKNQAEADCFDLLQAKGYKVTKRGWPDFFCWNDAGFIAVEVKKDKFIPLKTHQMMVMQALAKHGVTCYRWSRDAGFEKIEG